MQFLIPNSCCSVLKTAPRFSDIVTFLRGGAEARRGRETLTHLWKPRVADGQGGHLNKYLKRAASERCRLSSDSSLSFLHHPTRFLCWRATEERSKQHSRRCTIDTVHSHTDCCLRMTEEHWGEPQYEIKKVPLSFFLSIHHTYNQSNMDIWTSHAKREPKTEPGMIILSNTWRGAGDYCTLNDAFMSIQFVYECIHG